MVTNPNTLNIVTPWEWFGADDPCHYGLNRLTFLGVHFHVEAFAVESTGINLYCLEDDQQHKFDVLSSEFSDTDFQTVELVPGFRHVIVITPFDQ